MLLRLLRAKDALIPIFLALTLTFTAPAVRAQEYMEAPAAEETEMVADASLNASPPQVNPAMVVAPPLDAQGYRPPIAPPASANNAPRQRQMMAPAAPAQPAYQQAYQQQPQANPAYANQSQRPTAQMAAPANAAYAETTYVVQPGDTAPLIAKKVYGTSRQWVELLTYNQIGDPNMVRVGQRLRIPGLNQLAQISAQRAAPQAAAPTAAPRQATYAAPGYANQAQAPTQGGYAAPVHPTQVPAYPQQAQYAAPHAPQAYAQPQARQAVPRGYETVAPEPAPAAPVAKMPVTKPAMATQAQGMAHRTSVSADAEEADAGYYGQAGGRYTVQRGDTLGKIAKKLLGSTKRWREISRANPQINPNKLIAGSVLVIPGPSNDAAGVPAPMNTSMDANSGMAAPTGYPMAPPMSYEPPPVAPPASNIPGAPPPMSMTPPAAPPMMSGGPMMEPPPPPPVGMGAYPLPAAEPAPSTQTLYREERYRVPDELKPTDITPYYANFSGYHGLLETESALYPYLKTWHFGVNFRYDKFKYLNGKDGIIDGRRIQIPVNLLYTGRKLMVGLSVPFQDWDVRASTGGPTVSLSGLHDPELKAGYQIWKNYEGTHAVALHVAGRFPGDNYHQPLITMTGKSRVGVRVGPANATRGAWTEFGGSYTGQLTDRWNSHLNLALANDSEDSIARYIYRGMLDYRVNHHLTLMAEMNGQTWEMDNGPDGPNVDLTLGCAVFNADWQGVLGFPIGITHDWGYGHDFGVTFGVNTRWD